MENLRRAEKFLNRHRILVVSAIFLMGMAVRIHHINAPPIDAHSAKQTEVFTIAKKFTEEVFNPLLPRIHVIVPDTNMERIFFSEFPVYESTVAILWKIFGTRIWIARLVSIAAAAGTSTMVFLVGRKIISSFAGLIAAVSFNLFPLTVIYGRTIQPDMFALFLATAAGYTLLRARKGSVQRIYPASFLLSLASAMKPYLLIFLLPYIAMLRFMRKGTKRISGTPIIFIILSISFPVLWILWTLGFPKDVYKFTHSDLDQFAWDSRFLTTVIKGRVIDGEHFTKIGFALILLGVGLSLKTQRWRPIAVWFFVTLFGMFFMQNGNINHQYYQLPLAIPGALAVGVSSASLMRNGLKKRTFRFFGTILLCVIIGAIWMKEFARVKTYRPELDFENFLPGISAVQKIVSSGSRVILVIHTDGLSTLLNLIGRDGWIVSNDQNSDDCNTQFLRERLKKLVKMDARYLIVPKKDIYMNNRLIRLCPAIQSAVEEVVKAQAYEDSQLKVFRIK